MNIFDELAKPFPETSIHWRVGATNARSQGGKATKGIALAYIDARDVMDRLDLIVGPANWQREHPYTGCCRLGVRIDGEWIWRADVAGETAVEGEKGQSSDAFKRAAVNFGIARYLYGLPNVWYDLDERGRFKTEPKLPAWATPGGWNRIPASQKKAVYELSVLALERGDGPGLKEVWDEWSQEDKAQLWGLFDSKQRAAMKELLK